jgi:hypothetical protein
MHRIGSHLGAASTGLLDINPPWLTVGDLRQPLVGTSAFQVAEIRGSTHQLPLSRNSQCSDVVDEEWNPQILMNWPVTNIARSISHNVKTRGLQQLQLPDSCEQQTSR